MCEKQVLTIYIKLLSGFKPVLASSCGLSHERMPPLMGFEHITSGHVVLPLYHSSSTKRSLNDWHCKYLPGNWVADIFSWSKGRKFFCGKLGLWWFCNWNIQNERVRTVGHGRFLFTHLIYKGMKNKSFLGCLSMV